MAVKNRIQAITALDFDTGNLTASLQLVGTLPQACFFLKFLNSSGNVIVVSYDGTNPNDVVLANSGFEINGQTNAALSSGVALFPKGMPIYVTSETSTAGDFFVIGYYQAE